MATLDMEKTVSMLQAIDQRKAFMPEEYFSKNLFHMSENIAGEEVIVDIIKGTRRVAPFVHWKQEAPIVNPTVYVTSRIIPPYIKEMHVITAEDLKKRLAGENFVRKNLSPAAIRAQLEGERVQNSIDAIHRRRELMCSKLLHYGKVSISGKGYNAEIDYQRNPDNTVTLAAPDLWSVSDSKPLDDLSQWKQDIAEQTGYSATVAIFGFKAHRAFVNNPQVKDLLNIWNMRSGMLDLTKMTAKGVSWFGTYDGIELYTYNEWYKDPDTGLSTRLVETNKVIVAVPEAQNTLHYAQIMDLEAMDAGLMTDQYPIFPKFWMTPEPSAENILVQSAPLACLNEPDTTICAEVVSA